MPFPYSFPLTLGYVTPEPRDHESEAIERLITALRNTNVEDLIAASVSGLQTVEDAAVQLHGKRMLVGAEGDQLDGLGDIVGEARQGRSDSRYLTWIKARAKVNRSSGTIEEITEVTRLICSSTASVQVEEQFPHGINVFLSGEEIVNAEEILSILQEMKAGGVRLLVEYTNTDPDNTFTLDSSNPSQGLDNGIMTVTLE